MQINCFVAATEEKLLQQTLVLGINGNDPLEQGGSELFKKSLCSIHCLCMLFPKFRAAL